MRNLKLHIPLARSKAGRRRKNLKITSGRVQKQGRLGPVCLLDRRDLGTFEPGEEEGEQKSRDGRYRGLRPVLALHTVRSVGTWHRAEHLYSAGGSVLCHLLALWQVRLVCWPAL